MTDEAVSDEPVTDEPVGADDEHHARVVRSLRRCAALVGIPLTLALVLPWNLRRGNIQFAWDIAERYDHVGFVLLPMCGVLFVAAAFARRWRYVTRARVVGFAGVAVCGLGLILLHVPTIYELRHMWRYAPYILAVTPVVAVGFEMAMHARPRSKALTRLALLGWIAMFGVYCTPMDADLDFDSSMLGATVKALDRGRGDAVIGAMIMLGLWVLAFAGVTQAMRRLGDDREEAARKRFRTSWLGYLLYPVPMILATTLGLIGQLDDLDDMLEVFIPFAGVFGVMFGTSLGLCHLTVLAADHPVVRANIKRAALALGVAILAIALFRALMPDRRDAHVAELWWEMAETVCDALEGQPVPSRYLGGYAEFDLRSAATLLDVPEGTTFEPELFAVETSVGYWRNAKAVALGPDELRWAQGSGAQHAHPELLRRADPVLLEAVSRLADASAATGCLPELSADDLAGMPAPANALGRGGEICSGDDGARERFGDRRGIEGGIGDYLIVVRASNGQRYALQGVTRFDSGRLWIGNPVVPES